MEATDLLMAEHRRIERALDAMEAWLGTLVPGSEKANKAELSRYVAFIQGFADAHHHGKEEDILFATMVEHGFPRHAGPIAVMLHEHDMGRSLIDALDELARRTTPWSDEDRTKVDHAAREFCALLRQHIRKEDQVLYPMADARLPRSAQEEMLRRFQEHEARQANSGETERLRLLGDALTGPSNQ